MKLVKLQKKCCNKPKKFWNLQPKIRQRRQGDGSYFVTNERSHELNLEYRDHRPSDRCHQPEYKPELKLLDEEDLLKTGIGRDDV